MADASSPKKRDADRSWAATAGAGDRDGAFLGLTGAVGAAVALAGSVLLMSLCPAVVMYMCASRVQTAPWCAPPRPASIRPHPLQLRHQPRLRGQPVALLD